MIIDTNFGNKLKNGVDQLTVTLTNTSNQSNRNGGIDLLGLQIEIQPPLYEMALTHQWLHAANRFYKDETITHQLKVKNASKDGMGLWNTYVDIAVDDQFSLTTTGITVNGVAVPTDSVKMVGDKLRIYFGQGNDHTTLYDDGEYLIQFNSKVLVDEVHNGLEMSATLSGDMITYSGDKRTDSFLDTVKTVEDMINTVKLPTISADNVVVYQYDDSFDINEMNNDLYGYDYFLKEVTDHITIVEQNVNINQAGTYNVKYKLIGSDNKSVEKTITVQVLPRYKVQFETNNGTPTPEAQILQPDALVVKPQPPVRTDFDFEGWYIDRELTTPYDFSSTVHQDMILYAKWSGATVRRVVPIPNVIPPTNSNIPNTAATSDMLSYYGFGIGGLFVLVHVLAKKDKKHS